MKNTKVTPRVRDRREGCREGFIEPSGNVRARGQAGILCWWVLPYEAWRAVLGERGLA